MTYDEAITAVRAAEEWCDSCGDGPQPFTFGALTAAALRIIHEHQRRPLPGTSDRTPNGTLARVLDCTGCPTPRRKAVVVVLGTLGTWRGDAACAEHVSDVIEFLHGAEA